MRPSWTSSSPWKTAGVLLMRWLIGRAFQVSIWCSITANSPCFKSQTVNTSEHCVMSRTASWSTSGGALFRMSSSNPVMCEGTSEEPFTLTCFTNAFEIPDSVAGIAVAKGSPCRKKCLLHEVHEAHLTLVPEYLNDLERVHPTVQGISTWAHE